MQALLIHKLLSNQKVKSELYLSIHERIAKYNKHFYGEQNKDTPSDHLVFYGFYTWEVAKFIGIDRPVLQKAFSFNPRKFLLNLRFELFSPNNALKYRMDGEYKVEGVEKYARDIFAFNDHYVVLLYYTLNMMWDRFLGYLCIAMLAWKCSVQPLIQLGSQVEWKIDEARWVENWKTVTLPCATSAILLWLLVLAFERNLPFVFVPTRSLANMFTGPKAILQPLFMAYTCWVGEWYWCLVIYAFFSSIAFLGRQFYLPLVSARYFFNDCKFKHLFRPFWEEYKVAYAKVCASKKKKKKEEEEEEMAKHKKELETAFDQTSRELTSSESWSSSSNSEGAKSESPVTES